MSARGVLRRKAGDRTQKQYSSLQTEHIAFAVVASAWLAIIAAVSRDINLTSGLPHGTSTPAKPLPWGGAVTVTGLGAAPAQAPSLTVGDAASTTTERTAMNAHAARSNYLHDKVALSVRNSSMLLPDMRWEIGAGDIKQPPNDGVIGDGTYTDASNPYMVVAYNGSFFGQDWPTHEISCPVPCVVTSDTQKYGQRADVLVFHAPELDWDVFWQTPKPQHQLWALHSMESQDAYTIQQASSPAWQRLDIQATYKLSAVKPGLHHVPVPYLNSGQYGAFQIRRPAMYNKTGLALWMHNNCDAVSSRELLVQHLMRLMPIDSAGTCLNNMDAGGMERTAPTELMAQYKFYLVFENVFGDADWVSSTFFRALDAGTVPVVLGAPNVLKFAPGERSIIRACDFDSQHELVEYLMYLDRNETAYREYLHWKEVGPSVEFKSLMAMSDVSPWCQMCVAAARQIPWAFDQQTLHKISRHNEVKHAFDVLNAQLDMERTAPCRGNTAWWHVELTEEQQAKLWRVQ